MRESHIEKKVSEYAKANGWLTYKFSSPNNRGVPDRVYMKEGVVFFIEFKALGKTTTTLQEKNIQRIREQNIKVFVVDDIEEGKKIVDSF